MMLQHHASAASSNEAHIEPSGGCRSAPGEALFTFRDDSDEEVPKAFLKVQAKRVQKALTEQPNKTEHQQQHLFQPEEDFARQLIMRSRKEEDRATLGAWRPEVSDWVKGVTTTAPLPPHRTLDISSTSCTRSTPYSKDTMDTSPRVAHTMTSPTPSARSCAAQIAPEAKQKANTSKRRRDAGGFQQSSESFAMSAQSMNVSAARGRDTVAVQPARLTHVGERMRSSHEDATQPQKSPSRVTRNLSCPSSSKPDLKQNDGKTLKPSSTTPSLHSYPQSGSSTGQYKPLFKPDGNVPAGIRHAMLEQQWKQPSTKSKVQYANA